MIIINKYLRVTLIAKIKCSISRIIFMRDLSHSYATERNGAA